MSVLIMRRWPSVASGSIALGLLAAACVSSDRQTEPTRRADQAALTQNALTENALTQNALTQNALTQNALTQNALTQNALTQNELTAEALEDPDARLFLKYLIRVAFTPDQCETFPWADPQTGSNPAVYCGTLGLCTQWRDGGIDGDTDCQEWVTAGLLAHVNAFGLSVPISVRATAPSLVTISEYEAEAFIYREAGFWGNIFATPRQFYAAADVRNVAESRLSRRTCAAQNESCEIEVIGPVDVYSVQPALERGWACEITSSTVTWSDPAEDPALFFEADADDLDNLSATGDQIVSDCHSYLTKPDYVPTDEELASHTPRAVTVYLTEAGVKLLHGCSDDMTPDPTGGCEPGGGNGCDHPGDPCCEAATGARYCNDWLLPSGRTFAQACVNDEVSEGGQSSYTCSPVP